MKDAVVKRHFFAAAPGAFAYACLAYADDCGRPDKTEMRKMPIVGWSVDEDGLPIADPVFVDISFGVIGIPTHDGGVLVPYQSDHANVFEFAKSVLWDAQLEWDGKNPTETKP
jgi:hypothetical protein